MPYKDLHSKPFDDTTITKLEIYEDYAEAWLPTFIMQPKIQEIHVFDFFAGPGYDVNGIPSSPIRFLARINEHLGIFLKSKTKIVLHFNEYEPSKKDRQEKYELLKKNCEEYLIKNPKFKYFVEINTYNEDVRTLFFNYCPKLTNTLHLFI